MKNFLNNIFLFIQELLYSDEKNVCPRETSWNK